MATGPSKKILPHLEKRAPRFSIDRPRDARGKMRGRLRRMLAVAALCVALFALYPILSRQGEVRQRQSGLAQVTACDRLAAHPLDTQRTAPGVAEADLDVERAARACAQALRRQPTDGRTLYEAARVAFAAKNTQAGLEMLRRAAAAGYAQGEFTLGLFLLKGDGVASDACESGRLLVLAARQRHLFARLALAENWRDEAFRTCQLEITEPEIGALLAAADELAATPGDVAAVDTARRKWGS